MIRAVRKYTKEFKEEAVNLALKSPSIGGTAESKSGKDMATIIEENRRLHKELTIAKEEKELLKKAATYFAQHQK